MGILRKQPSRNGYTRIEEWDPEERKHREAQFLIYKTLQKADEIAKQSRSSWLIRLRFCKLKLKVGRRLKRLRRGVVSSLCRARAGLSRQVPGQLKAWGWRLQGGGGGGAAVRLPKSLVA